MEIQILQKYKYSSKNEECSIEYFPRNHLDTPVEWSKMPGIALSRKKMLQCRHQECALCIKLGSGKGCYAAALQKYNELKSNCKYKANTMQIQRWCNANTHDTRNTIQCKWSATPMWIKEECVTVHKSRPRKILVFTHIIGNTMQIHKEIQCKYTSSA